MAKFLPGISGNPNGRPKGSLSKRTELAKLLEPHANELVEKVISLAKGGEANALKLCIERLIPKAKDEAVILDISDINASNPAELLELGNTLISETLQGNITSEQASKLFSLLKTQGEMFAVYEMNERLANIEKTLKERIN
jgi:hypothetical protein